MTMKRRILCSLILSLVMAMQSEITLAQTPNINTTVYADKARFESQEEIDQFRVEVFNSSGQKMFDSGFVAGQTLDWNMLDQQGEAVADGVYDYVVTVKNRHGKERATQSRQLPIFRDGQDLEKAPTLLQVAVNGNGSGNVTGSGTSGQITKWTGATTLGDSVISESSGKVGIGTTNPVSLLHVIGSHPATSTLAGTNATEGLRLSGGKGGDTSGAGQTAGIGAGVVLQAGDGGDALSGTSGRGGFVTIQPGAPGVGALNGAFGQVILAPGGGNVGIGLTNAGSKLTVAGMIETTLGGLKFPDGTLQTTSATSGLASVFHDATLTGNGIGGSPLGIASGGVGTGHLADASVTTFKIASGAVNTMKLADSAVTAAKIAPGQVVKSLNGLFDNVTVVAGSNITITLTGNTLTIAASGGGFQGIEAFDLGTGTFVVPAGVTHLMVELWGAGGGGGGGGASTTVNEVGYGGSAGAEGIYTRKIITVTPGATLDVVVGAGGAGGALGLNGSAGGETKIVSSGTVLAFAGGGGCGFPGSTSQVGFRANPGQLDPFARISASTTGLIFEPDEDGIQYGIPPFCSFGSSGQRIAGGLGRLPGLSFHGTIVPPANFSIGGKGGTGQFAGSTGDCGTLPPGPIPGPAGNGVRGYALISW